MSLTVKIEDGAGRGYKSEITKDGEDLVISSSYPPLKPQKVRPFRQYLTDDGLTTGSTDMSVNGSVTNVDFWIPASEDYDRYITSINFLVGYGTTGQPNQWGDGTVLTNGCRLYYSSSRGDVEIHEAIKSNQDFFRLSFDLIPTAWEVRHLAASNDFGYIMSMDLTKLGLPFGIKLDIGTAQKLTMTIKDNVATAVDSFDMIAYGFERFE